MNYITNDEGEIKVIDKNGKTKWVSKLIAENTKVLKNTGLTIMEAPQVFEPIITESEETEESISQFQQEFSSEGAELAEPIKKEVKKAKKAK